MNAIQNESFKQAAMPLIKWLRENVHPHHTVIVTSSSAELLEEKEEVCNLIELETLSDGN